MICYKPGYIPPVKCCSSAVSTVLSLNNSLLYTNVYICFIYVYFVNCVVHRHTSSKMEKNNSWWRHQMETFSTLLAICAGNSPVLGEFPTPRPVTRSFDFFFDLRLNKWFSKQSWGWWFETLSRPLWRHRNVRLIMRSWTATHVAGFRE